MANVNTGARGTFAAARQSPHAVRSSVFHPLQALGNGHRLRTVACRAARHAKDALGAPPALA